MVQVRHKSLTPRELEIALLVERDLSNYETARELGIKPGTVKIHIHNILIKLEGRDSELGPLPRRRSKGPATASGRKQISEAQRRRWQRWRAARSGP